MSLPTFDQIYNNSYNYNSQYSSSYNASISHDINSIPFAIMQTDIWQSVAILTFVISLPFLIGAIYFFVMTKVLWSKEEEEINSKPLSLYGKLLYGESKALNIDENKTQQQLNEIKNMANSDEQETRKMAIMEADVLLDEVLKSIGLQKGSVGERLKKVNAIIYPQVELAWQAHKIRNKIAHEGSKFNLTKELARSTVIKYEQFINAVLNNII